MDKTPKRESKATRQALFSISDLKEQATRFRDMANSIDVIIQQLQQKEASFTLEISDTTIPFGLRMK